MMRIYVKVKPNSGGNEVKQISGSELSVRLTASAEKGKANSLLIRLLSKYFGVSKSEVQIVGGKTARKKIIDIG